MLYRIRIDTENVHVFGEDYSCDYYIACCSNVVRLCPTTSSGVFRSLAVGDVEVLHLVRHYI